jgi:hypothetical protein
MPIIEAQLFILNPHMFYNMQEPQTNTPYTLIFLVPGAQSKHHHITNNLPCQHYYILTTTKKKQIKILHVPRGAAENRIKKK